MSRPNQKQHAETHDLKLYDFGAAIDALKGMDTAITRVRGITRPGPIDNAMPGPRCGICYILPGVPVPIGMWRPFSRKSSPFDSTLPASSTSITNASQC